MTPRIDKNALRNEDQTCERVLRMERWLQDWLEIPSNLEKIPIHEGCHLFYFRQIHKNAQFVPPCIRYSDSGEIVPIKAAVDTKGINKKCDEPRLAIFGKAAVCGGVIELARELDQGKSVEQILKDLKNIGDVDDRKDFKTLCADINAASPDLKTIDSAILWTDSQIAVAIDLFNPTVRKEIDASVAQVKAELFASIFPTPENPSSTLYL
jgi:hypothetical protein